MAITLTVLTNISDSDIDLAKQIIKFHSATSNHYRSLDDYITYMFKKLLNNDPYLDNPGATFDDKRFELLSSRSSLAKVNSVPEHEVTFEIHDKMLGEHPEIFGDLADNLAQASYWSVDALINYIITQLLVGQDEHYELPLSTSDKIIFKTARADMQLAILKKKVGQTEN